MIDRALLSVWMKLDLTCLPANIGHMKLFLQQKKLCFSTLNVLHMKSVNPASVKSRVFCQLGREKVGEE